MPSIRQSALTLFSASLLGLTACSANKDDTADAPAKVAAASPASGNLADSLGASGETRTMADALAKTGVRTVFDEKASYTLLAPRDAAFAALGDKAGALIDATDHAALAALIKDHMIPGYVTPQDIGDAIAARKGGKVTMRTLSGGDLTFTSTADGIQVATADGSKATLAGEHMAAGSSVAIPIDGVLKAM